MSTEERTKGRRARIPEDLARPRLSERLCAEWIVRPEKSGGGGSGDR